jgi:hypothetical protein
LIIDRTVNEFRSLQPIAMLNGERPLLTAVNRMNWLEGLDILGEQPVGQIVSHLDKIRDLRFGSDRLFDQRFGDFIVNSLKGFSARQLDTGHDQVMIESVMRDRILYVNMAEIEGDGDKPAIVQYRLRMANGEPLPDWVSFDARGAAIMEIPAGTDSLHLIVDAVRADGTVLNIPIVIQGGTGEIELDRAGGTMPAIGRTLSRELGALANATDVETLQLLANFGGR